MKKGMMGWAAVMGLSSALSAAPLVLDPRTGYYQDLSYEALSEEGLSWEQRVRLFGGETEQFGPLTDEQRKAAQAELKDLLGRIDGIVAAKAEWAVHAWLREQADKIPAAYEGRDTYLIRTGAVVYFRAYEIFKNPAYLKAGLKRAELIRQKQWPKGHWPWPGKSEDFVRIQDGYNDWPFWVMLYASKVSGKEEYLESAKRCADLLLTLQRPGGGWGDQWSFSGAGSGHTGVRNGITFNDNGTNSTFAMMVMMCHITKDPKYIANLGKLAEFIRKANLGEGKVVGWAEQYHDNAKPVRARGYEIELPYPRALTRAIGPLLIWFYLSTGEEEHMDLLRKAYAWHEHVRQIESNPTQLGIWDQMTKSWTKAGRRMHYRPGWPDAWLPDGTNWGRVTSFKMIPWYQVTDQMKKKYGGLIHRSETDGGFPGKCGYLPDWGKTLAAGGGHPECSLGFSHAARGNSLAEVRRALLEHKRGGRKALLRYYTHPTKYTPDQYLQARIAAAKRCLIPRNATLADGPLGMDALKDSSSLVNQKGRWYGGMSRGKDVNISKWGSAFNTTGQWGSTAWYQWQFLYDVKLAQGKVSAEAAARGGRGLESVASQHHLDSWDILGEWGMATHEVENHFAIPLKTK